MHETVVTDATLCEVILSMGGRYPTSSHPMRGYPMENYPTYPTWRKTYPVRIIPSYGWLSNMRFYNGSLEVMWDIVLRLWEVIPSEAVTVCGIQSVIDQLREYCFLIAKCLDGECGWQEVSEVTKLVYWVFLHRLLSQCRRCRTEPHLPETHGPPAIALLGGSPTGPKLAT